MTHRTPRRTAVLMLIAAGRSPRPPPDRVTASNQHLGERRLSEERTPVNGLALARDARFFWVDLGAVAADGLWSWRGWIGPSVGQRTPGRDVGRGLPRSVSVAVAQGEVRLVARVCSAIRPRNVIVSPGRKRNTEAVRGGTQV